MMFTDKCRMSRFIILSTAALLLTAAQPAAAQHGTVLSHQKISDTQGGFTGVLDDSALFSGQMASLGDLDGDGLTDLAVGAPRDDDGGFNRGAVWVLFLDGSPNCAADLDGDGDADADDFFDYLDAFAADDLDVCDIDGDADCDADDFFGYLDLFAAGCP